MKSLAKNPQQSMGGDTQLSENKTVTKKSLEESLGKKRNVIKF